MDTLTIVLLISVLALLVHSCSLLYVLWCPGRKKLSILWELGMGTRRVRSGGGRRRKAGINIGRRFRSMAKWIRLLKIEILWYFSGDLIYVMFFMTNTNNIINSIRHRIIIITINPIQIYSNPCSALPAGYLAAYFPQPPSQPQSQSPCLPQFHSQCLYILLWLPP